jgi:hypothetical protein
MNKDFTIIFQKIDEQTQVDAPEQNGVVVVSGEHLAEMDELAELSRVVAEITDPEPLYFTTA